NFEYNNELTYSPSMAPRSANRSSLENGGSLQRYREALYRRGEFRPLVLAFNSLEGPRLDYIRNQEEDDCDSRTTLLSSADASKSLVACADRLGNISRVLSGINNHTTKGRKKQNIKFVRFTVDKECVVLLVANRDISKGERLHYDYYACEYEYPTHYFS
ncbi:hypothetical protein MIMGU_mgv11b022679mg, partial [Erythranthe guttata]